MKQAGIGIGWIVLGCLFFPPLILIVLAVYVYKSLT